MTYSNQLIRQQIFSNIPSGANYNSEKVAELRELETALLDVNNNARDRLLSDHVPLAFINRVETGLVIGTTCRQLSCVEDIPKAVEEFLNEHDLPMQLAVQPIKLLHRLEWDNIDISQDVSREDSVSVCIADYGIAETASVVIRSGSEMPILLSFLASYQIIILKRNTILAFLEDYASVDAKLAAQNSTPRNTSLITGCSGTTDIEGVLVQGAHGPKIVQILIVDHE